MGCGGSKDDMAPLADDFFGDDGTPTQERAAKKPPEQVEAQQQQQKQKRSSKSQPQYASPKPASPKSKSRSSSNNTTTNNHSPNTKPRKSNFVAPPSSESFVAKPAFSPRKSPKSNANAVAAPTPPPPPPYTTPSSHTHQTPGGDTDFGSSVGNSSRDSQRSPPRRLDDDDFSVAPSLDLEMRSVSTKTFDDVYIRGKQVRTVSVA